MTPLQAFTRSDLRGFVRSPLRARGHGGEPAPTGCCPVNGGRSCYLSDAHTPLSEQIRRRVRIQGSGFNRFYTETSCDPQNPCTAFSETAHAGVLFGEIPDSGLSPESMYVEAVQPPPYERDTCDPFISEVVSIPKPIPGDPVPVEEIGLMFNWDPVSGAQLSSFGEARRIRTIDWRYRPALDEFTLNYSIDFFVEPLPPFTDPDFVTFNMFRLEIVDLAIRPDSEGAPLVTGTATLFLGPTLQAVPLNVGPMTADPFTTQIRIGVWPIDGRSICSDEIRLVIDLYGEHVEVAGVGACAAGSRCFGLLYFEDLRMIDVPLENERWARCDPDLGGPLPTDPCEFPECQALPQASWCPDECTDLQTFCVDYPQCWAHPIENCPEECPGACCGFPLGTVSCGGELCDLIAPGCEDLTSAQCGTFGCPDVCCCGDGGQVSRGGDGGRVVAGGRDDLFGGRDV